MVQSLLFIMYRYRVNFMFVNSVGGNLLIFIELMWILLKELEKEV
jgi:hypothetical protein